LYVAGLLDVSSKLKLCRSDDADLIRVSFCFDAYFTN